MNRGLAMRCSERLRVSRHVIGGDKRKNMNSLYPSEHFGLEMQRSLTGFVSRFLICMVPVLLVGAIQGFRFGFHSADYLFLVSGSVLSVVATFFYALVGILKAYGRTRQFWMFPAVWAGFIPYLFVVYLAFVRGLWGFVGLFSHFTLSSLIAAVIFTLIGLVAIQSLHMITHFCSRIVKLTKNENA
jgi:hypothetical protein